MHFKFDWASLIVGSKFIVFALCYFVFEGNFPSTRTRGDYIWRVFCVTGFRGLYLKGLIHGGAHFRYILKPVELCVSRRLLSTSP